MNVEAGDSKNLTATGDVFTKDCVISGFYVNSTTAGTVVLKKGGSGGTALGGTITPAIGFHWFPQFVAGGLHATIGGALDITFFYVPTGT